MKKILLSLILISSAVFAKTEGSIGFILAKLYFQDNFSYYKTNNILYTNGEPRKFERYYLLPTFTIDSDGWFAGGDLNGGSYEASAGYRWSEGNAIYLTSSGVGVEQTLGDSFYWQYKYSTSDVYANPYNVLGDREVSQGTYNEFKAGTQGIVSFTYTLKNTDIDDIHVNSDAKQSGIENELDATAMIIPFGKKSYGGFGIFGGNGDFDGDSNNYYKIGGKYQMELNFGSNKLVFEVKYSKYDFSHENSYFNKKRDEEDTTYTFIYSKQGLFNDKDLYVNFLIHEYKRDSNIDFFKKNTKVIGINIGYKF